MFDKGGFGDHADPQLSAFVGVWAFERGEVGAAQLGFDMVSIPDFVGYRGLRAGFQQQRTHAAGAAKRSVQHVDRAVELITDAAFRHQHVPVGEERHAPGMIQTLRHDGHMNG